MDPKPWYASTTIRTAVGLFFAVLYLAFPKFKDVFEGVGLNTDGVLNVLAGVGGLAATVLAVIRRLSTPVQQPIRGSSADPTK